MENLDPKKQARLDELMTKNTEGALSMTERRELVALVRCAEKLMLEDARALAAAAHAGRCDGRPWPAGEQFSVVA